MAVQLSSKITYILWGGDGRHGVSAWMCRYREDHVPTVGGQWTRRSECVAVQLSRKITYNLWVDNGRDGVSAWFCNYQTGSRTICGRAMDETE